MITRKQAEVVWAAMTEDRAVFAAYRFWRAGRASVVPSAPVDFLRELADGLGRQEVATVSAAP